MLYEALAQFGETGCQARVDQLVADAGHEATQYARVVVDVELDGLAPGDSGKLVSDPLLVAWIKGHRGGHVGYHYAPLLVVPLLEDLHDARQQSEALAFHQ